MNESGSERAYDNIAAGAFENKFKKKPLPFPPQWGREHQQLEFIAKKQIPKCISFSDEVAHSVLRLTYNYHNELMKVLTQIISTNYN